MLGFQDTSELQWACSSAASLTVLLSCVAIWCSSALCILLRTSRSMLASAVSDQRYSSCGLVHRRLAELGTAACQQRVGIAPFQERWRDTHDFARRAGRLPEQHDTDIVDYRGLLHRDGSVLSSVNLQARLSLLLERLLGICNVHDSHGHMCSQLCCPKRGQLRHICCAKAAVDVHIATPAMCLFIRCWQTVLGH